MEKLARYCKHQKYEMLIGCDFNGHHVNCDAKNITGRGKSPHDYVIGNNICILNRSTKPTFKLKSSNHKIYYIEHNGIINVNQALTSRYLTRYQSQIPMDKIHYEYLYVTL